MNKLLYCEICDDLVEYKVISKEETFNIMNKEDVTLITKVAVCKCCDNELFEEELEKANQRKAFDIYRHNNNILSPEEMIATRNRYGLTQKEMSRLLGWGDITYHRYEKGSIPDQAHNNQLLLIKNPQNVLMILENGNHGLEEEKAIELKERITDLLSTNIQVQEISFSIPTELYDQLRLNAEKVGMGFEEYVRYLVMKNYYEDREKQTKEKTRQETSAMIIQELTRLSKFNTWRDKGIFGEQNHYYSIPETGGYN